MKRVFIVTVVYFLVSVLNGQSVSILHSYSGSSSPYIQDLYDFSLINNSSMPMDVILEVSLTEESSGLIYKAHTQPFALQPGMTGSRDLSIYLMTATVDYVAYAYQDFVIGMSPLFSGNFSWCVDVVYIEEFLESISECVNIVQAIQIPPSLAYPPDEDKIASYPIIFTWVPAFVPGFSGLTYYLRVVEREGKSDLDFADFISMPAIYEGTGIMSTNISASEIPPLMTGSKYSWSVAAELPGGSLLWSNEIWDIASGNDTTLKELRYVRPSYNAEEAFIEITKGEKIGIVYECNYSNEKLWMMVEDINGNYILKKKKAKIKLRDPLPGLNKYNIKASFLPNRKGAYLITLLSKYGKKQYLKIIIREKK